MRGATGEKALRETLVGALFSCVVVGLKFATLDVPYHWDEIGAYVAPAHWLADHGLWCALPGLHPPETFFGHPTGMYVLFAAWFRVVGDSIAAAHLLAVGFAFLGVLFTYRLAALLNDSASGWLAGALLFFTPIYFAQSGMVLADLPAASFSVMSVYYFLRGRPVRYAISAVFLVAIKETGAAVPLAIGLWLLWSERGRPGFIRRALGYASPLLLVVGFLAAQKFTTGRFVPNPYFSDRPILNTDPAEVLVHFVEVAGWILAAQHRWVLSIVILAALFAGRRSLAWRPEFTLFAILGACFAIVFSFVYVLPRYLLPTFPFLCVVSAMALSSLVASVPLRAGATAIIIALFASVHFGASEARDSFSEDMQYVDVVRSHQEAARYVELHHPEDRVFALWPLSQAIADPRFGYVTRALTSADSREEADVVLCTRQGAAGNRDLAEWAREARFRLEHRVERRGKSVDIYVRDR